MNVLVTGNLGYIGSVLTPLLEESKYSVIGFDSGYFKDCTLVTPKNSFLQVIKDIREVSSTDLRGIDVVIHLAALSNDPVGELDPILTNSINFEATVTLAKLARLAKVKRFIYASTQSMYGISNSDEELDEYTSKKNPITAYAKSKWRAEQEIFKLSTDIFHVIAFRFATVFGVSPRFRSDIVFNNLMANAFLYKEIRINSDGTPWRPVIHVQDACKAILAGIVAPTQIVSSKVFNVGYMSGNYTVLQLAQNILKLLPDCKLSLNNEQIIDNRSYRVSFNRIYSELSEYFHPTWSLSTGALELINFFEKHKLTSEILLGEKCIRMKKLQQMQALGTLDKELRTT